ncbi:hypothetical protein ACLVWU_11695 [Bdellovibrio sp. HCB290]|uniref:hypothetical protein n=1 Tax=Bdellovibrio sp. HCB290 TaxID=3394356 RepID=UPI0039B603B0
MKARYLKALDHLELGSLREAEHLIEDMRRLNELTPAPETELLRRLLATRLHYKQNKGLSQGDQFLNENQTTDPLIKAEVYFVKGLNAFYGEDFTSGASFFKKAAELYPPEEFAAKALLAKYNEYIGLLNSQALDEAQEEGHLSHLERLAHRIEADKILGMILRQKSYLLERRGHLPSAFEAATESQKYLKKSGPISDYQLITLQMCDLLFEMGRTDEAAALFHGLLGPFESRVQFAHALVRAKISKSAMPSLTDFAVIPPVWKNKMADKSAVITDRVYVWYPTEGILKTDEGKTVSLKRDSLEGKILILLSQGRKDRASLCAALWPDDIEMELLHDRLKKSLKRLKEKNPDLVKFGCGFYSLAVTLNISQKK